MATKEEIMAAMLAKKNRGGNKERTETKSTGDNASYPFWELKHGETAILRFIPDKDPNNTFFWLPKETIKLPFAGIVGGEYPTNEEAEVTVPCMEMWDEQCPIIMGTKYLWKDEATKPIARQYWKKKNYLFQGFVVDSPIVEKEVPENPIRRFVIGQQIFGKIEQAMLDPEFLENPSDLLAGVDFRITSEAQGTFSNYGSSSWARRPRSLNEQELTAYETYGPWNLADFQGEKPSAEKLEMMKAMLADSLAGKPFDVASYGGEGGFRAYTKRRNGQGGGAPVAAAPAIAAVASQIAAAAPVAAVAAAAPAPAAQFVGDVATPAAPAPAVTAPTVDSTTATNKANDVIARINAMRGNANG